MTIYGWIKYRTLQHQTLTRILEHLAKMTLIWLIAQSGENNAHLHCWSAKKKRLICRAVVGDAERSPLFYCFDRILLGLLGAAGVKVRHRLGTKVPCFMTFPRPTKLNKGLNVGWTKERSERKML